MDTSYYRNFLTLVQIGNITEAAEALHITQPALSKQIKLLETEYGAPLIISKRGQKGITITEAGRVFIEQIQQVCNHEIAAREAVKRLTNIVDGTLRISVSASRATPLVQQALQFFHVDYPSVHFEIYEGVMKDVTEQLLSGISEIGICSEQLLPYDKFEVIHRSREDLYAIFRNDIFYDALDKNELTLEHLQKVPLSLSAGSVKMIIQNMPGIISDMEIISVSTNKSTALEWAVAGKAVAVIPMDLAERVNRYQMSRMRVSMPDATFNKVLVKAKDHKLSLVAQHFIDFYKQYANTSI